MRWRRRWRWRRNLIGVERQRHGISPKSHNSLSRQHLNDWFRVFLFWKLPNLPGGRLTLSRKKAGIKRSDLKGGSILNYGLSNLSGDQNHGCDHNCSSSNRYKRWFLRYFKVFTGHIWMRNSVNPPGGIKLQMNHIWKLTSSTIWNSTTYASTAPVFKFFLRDVARRKQQKINGEL